MMAYGYRTLILGDVKDEYEPLCRALGVEPHAVGHGLPARINPLDFGPLGNDWTHLPRAEAQRRAAMVFSRWLLLIKGLVGSQHVPLRPHRRDGGRSGDPRPHRLHGRRGHDGRDHHPRRLAGTEQPDRRAGRQDCRYPNRQHFLDETRPVRDALGSLVKGHLVRPVRRSRPRSRSTGARPSSRCHCPGSIRSATKRSASR